MTVQFTTPLPGLAPHTDYTLNPVADAEHLFTLQALADENVRLFLVDPSVVPGYTPALTDEQVAKLGLERAEDAHVLVVARMTEEGIGVNLLAPVVVNGATGVAEQVILDGQGYPALAHLA